MRHSTPNQGGRLRLRFLSIPPQMAVLWLIVCAVRPAAGQLADDRRAPTAKYYLGIQAYFNEGEYKDALDAFEDEWRGAIKTVGNRWVDSICYHTMIGECYYRMGRPDDALEHYNAAVQLYNSYPDWMIRVQFPPAIQPSQSGARIPWGPSRRGTRPGRYPGEMLIAQGRVNNNAVIQRGGVVQRAILYPLDVMEINRCTALAIRRRTELLGPLAQYDPMTTSLVANLSRRPAPPNHWSQSLVDVELGLAMVAAGKPTDAIPLLTRGSVAAGEFDHPLTSTALLALGDLAMERGEHEPAMGFYHEASISAAFYGDAGVLEEAFRHGAEAHLLANRRGVYPPLNAATPWVRSKDLRHLQASLWLSTAEQLAALGQTQPAGAALDEAHKAVGRRTMGYGWIGARAEYLRATVLFQQRRIPEGEEALGSALKFMQTASPWLFQIRTLEGMFTGGQVNTQGPITARAAMDLYTELLRDPSPSDWGLQPMDAMAVLGTPHSPAYEHWFLIALARNEHEKALEIADMARRHRYYSSLAMGGRLQALRWVLEAPDGVLSQQAKLQRQSLLADYPAYAALAQQAAKARAELEAMPLVVEDTEPARKQKQLLEELAAVSVQQEAILREMAVRREAAELVFPPRKTVKEIQAELPEGDVLLAFFAASGDLYAFMLDKRNYNHWRVKGAPLLGRQVVELLRGMGHFEQNRELSLQDLADEQWKKPAQGLLDTLFEGSRADLTADFPELVIVPDALLWYVPFEALQVEVDGRPEPLIHRFRIRYAPTVSLAVYDGRGRPMHAQTAVAVGRMYPREGDDVTQKAFDELARAVPGAVALPQKPPLPAPSAVYSTLMDQLVVLDDLNMEDTGPYGWAPIQVDRNKPGNSLSEWLALPWQAPGVVVLPGFHTAAEASLKRANRASPGAEVFLSVCGMMSSGARTILLSRWRTGGQTSFDLVREFAQELPHTTPADAFQRAVLVTSDTRLDLEAEPRIKRAAVSDSPKADHPFFWAGYMLVDSGSPPKPQKPAPGGVELLPGQPGGHQLQPGQPDQPAEPRELRRP